MKIFILDDMLERQESLLAALRELIDEDAVIFCADSRKTAIEVLEHEREFDLMFLDHDLGGRVYVDSMDENTGWWVAKYIVDNNIRSKQIIIHTLNWAGAQRMLNLLPKADFIPFHILIERLKALESSNR